jgi:hypothetical protein
MASLIVFEPGADWPATGGLFDWTLEFLMHRLSDKNAVEQLREIVDNNLGSLWVSDFPPQTQREIVEALRRDLIAAGERELPDGDGKAETLHHLQELVDLASNFERRA